MTAQNGPSERIREAFLLLDKLLRPPESSNSTAAPRPGSMFQLPYPSEFLILAEKSGNDMLVYAFHDKRLEGSCVRVWLVDPADPRVEELNTFAEASLARWLLVPLEQRRRYGRIHGGFKARAQGEVLRFVNELRKSGEGAGGGGFVTTGVVDSEYLREWTYHGSPSAEQMYANITESPFSRIRDLASMPEPSVLPRDRDGTVGATAFPPIRFHHTAPAFEALLQGRDRINDAATTEKASAMRFDASGDRWLRIDSGGVAAAKWGTERQGAEFINQFFAAANLFGFELNLCPDHEFLRILPTDGGRSELRASPVVLRNIEDRSKLGAPILPAANNCTFSLMGTPFATARFLCESLGLGGPLTHYGEAVSKAHQGLLRDSLVYGSIAAEILVETLGFRLIAEAPVRARFGLPNRGQFERLSAPKRVETLVKCGVYPQAIGDGLLAIRDIRNPVIHEGRIPGDAFASDVFGPVAEALRFLLPPPLREFQVVLVDGWWRQADPREIAFTPQTMPA